MLRYLRAETSEEQATVADTQPQHRTGDASTYIHRTPGTPGCYLHRGIYINRGENAFDNIKNLFRYVECFVIDFVTANRRELSRMWRSAAQSQASAGKHVTYETLVEESTESQKPEIVAIGRSAGADPRRRDPWSPV